MLDKPTIAELEKLLQSNEDGAVELQPNGEVRVLGPMELLEKNYKLEKERNAALLQELKELKSVLKQISLAAGKAIGE